MKRKTSGSQQFRPLYECSFSTYFILAPECLGGLINSKTAEGAVVYNTAVAYPIGIIFAIVLLVIFLRAAKKHAAA